MAISLHNIAPRTPPVSHTSWRLWLRQNLFANRTSTVTSVSLLLLGLWLLPQLWSWAVWHAQFRPDADACQSIRGIGACWGVVSEKYRIIIFGRYPFAEQWRPLLACGLLVSLLVVS